MVFTNPFSSSFFLRGAGGGGIILFSCFCLSYLTKTSSCSRGMAQVVETLTDKHKTLRTNSSTGKKKNPTVLPCSTGFPLFLDEFFI
jgi:hypothetical protein